MILEFFQPNTFNIIHYILYLKKFDNSEAATLGVP